MFTHYTIHVHIVFCVHYNTQVIVNYGLNYVLKGVFSDDIHHPFHGSHITSASEVGGIALALYSVLWAYEGWLATYVSCQYFAPLLTYYTGTMLDKQ